VSFWHFWLDGSFFESKKVVCESENFQKKKSFLSLSLSLSLSAALQQRYILYYARAFMRTQILRRLANIYRTVTEEEEEVVVGWDFE
jgi:hypothetical protein